MPKAKPCADQVAIVTGASQGIGLAIAEALASLGSRVALLARRPVPLEPAAAQVAARGVETLPLVCDVQKVQDVRKAFTEVLARFGRADVLVNNAGVGLFGPVQDFSEADWERVLNTNLRGAFYCSQAVIPQMIRQRSGHIINIASLAAKNGFAGGSVYCASKFGLVGFSYSMAEDLRGYGIRVSVICPGSVRTEFSPHTGKDPKKMLRPTDVARVVTLLVQQPEQSFISEVLLRPTQKP
ncbi:MAG: SDR family oxidoreductase [Terriglobia bacterium]